MTASVFIRHKVNDFAPWKKVYNEGVAMRTEVGVLADSVHRDPDDPNTIIVYNQYADLSTAQEAMAAMRSSEEWQSVLKKAGVKPETIEMWVGEDV